MKIYSRGWAVGGNGNHLFFISEPERANDWPSVAGAYRQGEVFAVMD